jgi:hypothetical protein
VADEFSGGDADAKTEVIVLDMFGEPASDYKDPRGRRKLRITNELRDRIATLSAAGMDREAIAEAIGCSERTLRTYFLPELNEGKATKRAEAIEMLWAAAKNGNVSAIKAVIALTEKGQAAPPAPKPKPAPKLGKKEQLAAAAQAGHQESDWGKLLN